MKTRIHWILQQFDEIFFLSFEVTANLFEKDNKKKLVKVNK